MRKARERQLETPLGRRAGLHWRLPGAPRVLCLHGWFDNAESFTPLAPHLDQLELFALDLPGHGKSEHRHLTARYHFIDYLWDVDAVLDALDWEDCHLIGHSMGAAISTVYGAGAPERVRSAVLLDTLGPISVTAESSTERLRRSLARNRRARRSPRPYASVDDMVAARLKDSDLSEASARLLCERSAHRVGDHFEWRSDPAINWVSSLVMTDDQALDFLRHIQAPVMSMMADPAPAWSSETKNALRRGAIANGVHHTVAGHHHFHMDEPEKIAGAVQTFILRNDQPAPAGGSHEQPDQN
jgi:pimeloyl-ACP methyl ester carboxylesterase